MKIAGRVEALSIRELSSCAPRNGCAFLELALEGVVGDVHFGFTKPADSRDTGIARGTPIRNWRQWSAVSIEELRIVASRMELQFIDPCRLSANLTFSGIPNLSEVPRGSSISLDGGAILSVEEQNAPCTGPGKEIALEHPGKKPHEFVKAAQHLRGLVGVVLRAGTVHAGAKVIVDIYEPRIFSLPGSIASVFEA